MDEGSLQKVAEYILNEQHSSSPVDVRFRQEIAVADGVDLMFHTLIYPRHDLIDVLHKYDSNYKCIKKGVLSGFKLFGTINSFYGDKQSIITLVLY
jgi:hypothetical protein